jgi:hypothetical protein
MHSIKLTFEFSCPRMNERFGYSGEVIERLYHGIFVFRLEMEHYSFPFGLEILDELQDNKSIDSFLPKIIADAKAIFSNGRRLSLFDTNKYKFYNIDNLTEGDSLPQPIIISLEIAEELYAKLLFDCEKREKINKIFSAFHSYLFEIPGYQIKHDAYAAACFSFISQCLEASIHQYVNCSDLNFVHSIYFRLKHKEGELDLARRRLYSHIRVPNVYERMPVISTEVEKIYSSLVN